MYLFLLVRINNTTTVFATIPIRLTALTEQSPVGIPGILQGASVAEPYCSPVNSCTISPE